MRVIVAGSRTIYDYDLVSDAIAKSGFEITTLISGGARGVDSLGERWARNHGVPVERFPANWEEGKLAGFKRNVQMAQTADALIAITNGSPGTRHMIETAERHKLLIYVRGVFKEPLLIRNKK